MAIRIIVWKRRAASGPREGPNSRNFSYSAVRESSGPIVRRHLRDAGSGGGPPLVSTEIAQWQDLPFAGRMLRVGGRS
jgi:hypothetical protein